MFILSKNALIAVFAMAACMASLANAAEEENRGRLRRRNLQGKAGGDSRNLKAHKKKAKGGGGLKAISFFGPARPATTVVTAAGSNNFFASKPTGVNPVQKFEQQCTYQPAIDNLDGCVPFQYLESCKTCLVGKSSLSLVSGSSSLKSCFQDEFPGFCTESCADQAIAYYGCGIGDPNFGTPVVLPETPDTPVTLPETPGVPVTLPAPVVPVVLPETPGTPVTLPETPTDPVVLPETPTNPVVLPETPGTPVNPLAPSDTVTGPITATITGGQTFTGVVAPVNFCPTSDPGSGTACNLQGYQEMECWYPGSVKCVCGYQSPIFLCTGP